MHRAAPRASGRGLWHRARPAVAGLLVLLGGLGLQAARAQAPADPEGAPPYDLEHPAEVFRLPNDLKEISGVTVLDDQYLGAVQDELGVLFVIDREAGAVTARRSFGGRGDYEDLAGVGRRVYVLRSDGTLFEIEDWQADSLVTRVHATRLSERYNTEGLAYDAAEHRLLIACKDFPGEGLRHKKAIYAFDLATRTWSEQPVLVIDIAAFNRLAPDHPVNEALRKLLAPAFDLSGLRPAALAVHPITGALYVLSSERKAILVMDRAGRLLHVWKLPGPLFPLPEGMTFLPNGDLFISNEGNFEPPTLLRFPYRPP